jgi:hypothetical protein
MMFVPSVYRTTYRIAQEKEMRTKESMYMMGLKPLPYWFSWFVYYFIVTTVLCCLCAMLMTKIFIHVNAFVMFLHIYTFGLALFGIIMSV